VIIAYGQIIPERLLGISKLGWINSHASLLPKYRGCGTDSVGHRRGETRTGITTMRIDGRHGHRGHSIVAGNTDRSNRDNSGACRAFWRYSALL